jgi:replicative DNA helicase
MDKFEDAKRYLDTLPLVLDDTSGLSITQLRMRVRDLQRSQGISLLVVDYLQKLAGSRQHRAKHEEVSEVSSALKDLAKELNIPVVALAQLKRADPREGEERRPTMNDLAESGQIERDADAIIFVHRVEYYVRNRKPPEHDVEAHAKWQAELRQHEGVAEAIVGKNRHGIPDNIVLGYEGRYFRFTDDPPERPPEPAEYRERAAKKPSVSADGLKVYGLLKSASAMHGRHPTPDELASDKRLLKDARLVPLEMVRDKYGQDEMPDAKPQTVETAFRTAFQSLRKAGLAVYFGTKETGIFLWLPELCA